MTASFNDIEELFDFARELRDGLVARSFDKEAQDLTHVIDGYWSTVSDALGSLLDSLESVKPCVTKALPPNTVERLDMAIHDIKVAFDRANNPNA